MRRFSTTVARTVKTLRVHNSEVHTRFPMKYNPARSAFKQEILVPAGVFYNPAPSAPTPLETPAVFLPRLELETRAWTKDAKSYEVSRMPPLKPAPRRTYHLTAKEAEEIFRLRQEEPYKWTRKSLAEKFGVSEKVVGMVSTPNVEHAEDMASRLGMIQGQWTDRRARARDHRARRKMFWLRDN